MAPEDPPGRPPRARRTGGSPPSEPPAIAPPQLLSDEDEDDRAATTTDTFPDALALGDSGKGIEEPRPAPLGPRLDPPEIITTEDLKGFLDETTLDTIRNLEKEWHNKPPSDDPVIEKKRGVVSGMLWMLAQRVGLTWDQIQERRLKRLKRRERQLLGIDDSDTDPYTDDDEDPGLSEDGRVVYNGHRDQTSAPTDVPGARRHRPADPVEGVQRYEFTFDDPEPAPGTPAHRTWEAAKAAYDRMKQSEATRKVSPPSRKPIRDPTATGVRTKAELEAEVARLRREQSEAPTPPAPPPRSAGPVRPERRPPEKERPRIEVMAPQTHAVDSQSPTPTPPQARTPAQEWKLARLLKWSWWPWNWGKNPFLDEDTEGWYTPPSVPPVPVREEVPQPLAMPSEAPPVTLPRRTVEETDPFTTQLEAHLASKYKKFRRIP